MRMYDAIGGRTKNRRGGIGHGPTCPGPQLSRPVHGYRVNIHRQQQHAERKRPRLWMSSMRGYPVGVDKQMVTNVRTSTRGCQDWSI